MKKRVYKCKYCQAEFPAPIDVAAHIRIEHRREVEKAKKKNKRNY